MSAKEPPTREDAIRWVVSSTAARLRATLEAMPVGDTLEIRIDTSWFPPSRREQDRTADSHQSSPAGPMG